MTQEEFKATAKKKIEKLINFISQGKYDKISSVAQIDDSWCTENKNQEEGIYAFKEWLIEQLALWSEDYEKEFVVDAFDESKLKLDDLKNGHSISEYSPTSHGEELDFWFELNMHTDDADDLILTFNINI